MPNKIFAIIIQGKKELYPHTHTSTYILLLYSENDMEIKNQFKCCVEQEQKQHKNKN